MNEGVLNAIENLVSIIYTPDQKGLNDAFGSLVEEISLFLERMLEAGYSVDVNEELLYIQRAFAAKDYTLLADVLLYRVKPGFLEIE